MLALDWALIPHADEGRAHVCGRLRDRTGHTLYSLVRGGAGGFLTTVVGILLVRSSGAVPGLDLYPAGALLVAIGWVLLSFSWWKTNRGPVFVPVLFVVSIITGLVGQIAPRAAILSVVSGLIFGAAMIGAGL